MELKNNLQQQIKELEELASSQQDRFTIFEAGIDVGSRETAKKAILIIKKILSNG